MDLSLDKLLADKENLERFLDSLMEGIIVHDKERRILYFNREAGRITGHGRTEILGRGCREVLASCAERDAHMRKGWWRTWERGEGDGNLQVQHVWSRKGRTM